MVKHELKKDNAAGDLPRSGDNVALPPIPPRDPIEPDPMNPVQSPPADTDLRPERPDLDWTEHED
jgi:hypothetical protein